MHWLLRTLAVLAGLILVLFGSLLVAACLVNLGQGANGQAAAKVELSVQIVITVIFAIVPLVGFFLIWLGMRRGTVGSALPNGSKNSQAVALTQGESPAAACELGEFIARCGPERSGETYNYVSAGVYLLIALVCVAAPAILPAGKIDPQTATLLSFIPAGIGVAAALLHVWNPLFGAPQTIELYEHGIVERLGIQVRRVELAAIEHLRLQEWYEHRFAARTFNVKALVRGQPQLAFSTALRGEAERIIEYLASKIPQTEIVEFNAT